MKWIWSRHGETEWNRERRYLGHTDVPLNEAGENQARLLAERLAHQPVNHIYSSDLQRCVQTAGVIVALLDSPGFHPVSYNELRELNFGEWEGKTYQELVEIDEARLTAWYQNPLGMAPPGGETLSQLGQRMERWLQEKLAVVKPDETVLIVTHGGPIRWFFSHILQADVGQFWQVNGLHPGEYVVVQYDGQSWRLDQA